MFIDRGGCIGGVVMADVILKRLHNPPIEVEYASLTAPESGKLYRECPCCGGGLLLLSRHPKTLKLLREDRCRACGQAVVFTDLKQVFGDQAHG